MKSVFLIFNLGATALNMMLPYSTCEGIRLRSAAILNVSFLLLARIKLMSAAENIWCNSDDQDDMCWRTIRESLAGFHEGRDANGEWITLAWSHNRMRPVDSFTYGKHTEHNYCAYWHAGYYLGKSRPFDDEFEIRSWHWSTCKWTPKYQQNPRCFTNQLYYKREIESPNGRKWGKLKLYPVKYQGRALFGWLFFKWETDKPPNPSQTKEETTLFIVQAETSDINKTMRDDTPISHAFHGQFFHHLHQKTPPISPGFRESIGVCQFAHDPAMERGSVFQFTYGDVSIGWDGAVVHLKNEIVGYHQMNFPICPLFGHENLDTRLWFRSIHDHRGRPPSANNPGIYYEDSPETDFLRLNRWVYGAADPKPPRGAVLDHAKTVEEDPPPWVIKEKSSFGIWPAHKSGKGKSDVFNHKDGDQCFQNRIPPPKGRTYKDYEERSYAFKRHPFGSRCNKRKPSNPNHNRKKYYCQSDIPWHTSKAEFQDVTNVFRHIYASSCSISAPTSEGDCKRIQNFMRLYGTSLSRGIGRNTWGCRQSHGIFMAFAGIFVIPCVNFLARYYKETFLSHRFLHMHVWYFCHAIGGILGIFALAIGFIVSFQSRLYLGFPLHTAAIAHGLLGYIALFVQVLNLAQNSWRIYNPPIIRRVSISLHAVTGYTVQFIGAIEIVTAAFMKGSPISLEGRCPGSLANPECEKVRYNNTAGFIAIAIFSLQTIAEIVFHFLMTANFRTIDAMENINRAYAYPVLIPIVPQSATSNRRGSEQRIFFLILYVAVNFVLTAALIAVIVSESPENRFSGPTRYTHKDKHTLKQDLLGLGNTEET